MNKMKAWLHLSIRQWFLFSHICLLLGQLLFIYYLTWNSSSWTCDSSSLGMNSKIGERSLRTSTILVEQSHFEPGYHQAANIPESLYEGVAKRMIRVEKIVESFRDISSDPHLSQNESFFVPRNNAVNGIFPRFLSQSSSCSQNLFLLVAIPSRDEHFAKRKAIRETWASLAYGHPWPHSAALWNYSVKVVFFLGLSSNGSLQNLRQESEQNQDIVRVNFSDNYRNLSLKMATVLQWAAMLCPNARHVMKVDEDTFVNVPLLLDVLKMSSGKLSRYILGHSHCSHQPPVEKHGRWQVSKDVYPLSAFPRYLYGHSYVISGDAIRPLFHALVHMPLVPNEDAYVTGILAKTANISRVHCQEFAVNLGVPNRCHLTNDQAISQTGFNEISQFYSLWNRISSNNCTTS